MTLKMLWRILTTPGCWLRGDFTDKRCNELIRYLLDNKDRVTTDFGNGNDEDWFFRLKLSIAGNSYTLWIRNKWCCYLSECSEIEGYSGLPSRSLCFEFYDAFEKPFREKHGMLEVKRKPETFIQPEKCDAEK